MEGWVEEGGWWVEGCEEEGGWVEGCEEEEGGWWEEEWVVLVVLLDCFLCL